MSKFSRVLVKGLGTAAMASAVVGGAMAPSASAGMHNVLFNCYGYSYSTDWDQNCGPSGAQRTGNYNSKADCSSSADKEMTIYRSIGDARSIDGADCTFSVYDVYTSYF